MYKCFFQTSYYFHTTTYHSTVASYPFKRKFYGYLIVFCIHDLHIEMKKCTQLYSWNFVLGNVSLNWKCLCVFPYTSLHSPLYIKVEIFYWTYCSIVSVLIWVWTNKLAKKFLQGQTRLAGRLAYPNNQLDLSEVIS